MTKVTLKYATLDGCDWEEKFATIEEAAAAAKCRLGRWCGGYDYLVGEFGDCKFYHVGGATIKDLEAKMKEVAHG